MKELLQTVSDYLFFEHQDLSVPIISIGFIVLFIIVVGGGTIRFFEKVRRFGILKQVRFLGYSHKESKLKNGITVQCVFELEIDGKRVKNKLNVPKTAELLRKIEQTPAGSFLMIKHLSRTTRNFFIPEWSILRWGGSVSVFPNRRYEATKQNLKTNYPFLYRIIWGR